MLSGLLPDSQISASSMRDIHGSMGAARLVASRSGWFPNPTQPIAGEEWLQVCQLFLMTFALSCVRQNWLLGLQIGQVQTGVIFHIFHYTACSHCHWFCIYFHQKYKLKTTSIAYCSVCNEKKNKQKPWRMNAGQTMISKHKKPLDSTYCSFSENWA